LNVCSRNAIFKRVKQRLNNARPRSNHFQADFSTLDG
jgi:hypothetical protein